MNGRACRGRIARSLLGSALIVGTFAGWGIGNAQAAVPSGNLIGDPGAEFGAEGWSTTGGFVAERYGAENRPSVAVGNSIGGGALFFAGGSEADVSSATQIIDVTDASSEIDTGKVTAGLSAYLGGISDEGDYAEVVASAQTAGPAAQFAEFARIGPVTAADRNNQTAFLLRSASATVPPGTRKIRVSIISTRLFGIYTDGYADNLTLTLTGTPATSRKGTVKGIKSPGRRIKGKVSATGPCKSGRKVVVKKGKKTIGSGRSKSSGAFNIKTKKHKKGKLTVTVRGKSTKGTVCAALTKKVPGRN